MFSTRRICGLLFLTVASGDLALFAQIGYPGGGYPGGGYPGGYPGRYPGGGYPGGYPGGGGIGIPMPGGKQKKDKKQDTVPTTTIEGKLRSLTATQVVLEADDTRLINLKRTTKTTFVNADGDAMKPADLNPGDHLQIDASEDDSGFFTAIKVSFDKAGTPAERAASSRPVDVGGAQSSQGSDGGGGADTDPDPDRPRLKRAGGPAPEEPAAAAPAPAAPTAAPVKASQPAPAKAQTVSTAKPIGNDDDLIDPRTAAEKSDVPVAPPSQSGDSDRPQLRRGRPAVSRTPVAERTEIASAQEPSSSNQPASPNQPVAPRAVRPTVTREQEPEAPVPVGPAVDPIIAKAMEASESFSETLPNYVCQQFTARFVTQSSSANWQAQDVVSAEVVYENGQENYRNLKINNKPIKKGEEEATGAWSRGEFGTLLRDVLSPATAADFRFRKDSYIAGTTAALYDFTVEHANSHWHIQVSSQSVLPSYKGSIWIDKKNGRVLRIEMQTRNMPGEFPADKVETATDWEYVRIGGAQSFLLPVHSENLMCFRGSNNCSRNAIDFRNYKKYSGESTITFDK